MSRYDGSLKDVCKKNVSLKNGSLKSGSLEKRIPQNKLESLIKFSNCLQVLNMSHKLVIKHSARVTQSDHLKMYLVPVTLTTLNKQMGQDTCCL